VPADDELLWIIGPPLRRNFEALLSNPDAVEAGIAEYRKTYAAGGMFEAQAYAGIEQVLATLKSQGVRLFVCTAKPVFFARQIVGHFGLAAFFDEIYGAELDGRFEDKADLIAHILKTEGFTADEAVMIGDRDNDTKSAARNNMTSIGVLWGFGDADELTNGGASALCAAPLDLLHALGGLKSRCPNSL
jgi:phosphoglycolate phosphatase